ncbi:LD-carboxypeptidase [Candidatus Uhrbacteria bacterium]|nr:LD-carboxypeptidase [Candidatus Uhrbacteria bacterium]
MKNITIPKKLDAKGVNVRVIAPVRSLGLISEEGRAEAEKRLAGYGMELSFGKHVEEMDEFNSSSIDSRIEDLHEAFSDDGVDAILTVIGGYNSNQLLSRIDYSLIERNPKIICGFSDVTALANAINAKTGMVTYVGPHYSTWGMRHGLEHTIEYFLRCCRESSAYNIEPSEEWSDDPWFMDQENREFIKNDGYWMLNEGHGLGRVVGGHLRCLSSLQGTEYWPGLDDSILFLEDDAEVNPALFDRGLQSLIHQPDFSGVRGILIGRFQKETGMTRELLEKMVATKPELKNIPTVANMDFGHTTPMVTLPIGGTIEIDADNGSAKIRVIEH